MNPTDKKIVAELFVAGDKKSTGGHNGSITTAGGVGIKKNLIVDEDITTCDLTVKKTAKINNLIINNDISVPSMFINNTDNISFKKNICSDSELSIGSQEKKWKIVHSKNIDADMVKSKSIITNKSIIQGELIIKNNDRVYFTSNKKETNIYNKLNVVNNKNESIVSIDPEINKMIVRTDVFSINGLFNVSKDNRQVLLRGILDTNIVKINNFLQIEPQKVIINKNQNIKLLSSILLLKVNKKSHVKLLLNSAINNSLVDIYVTTQLLEQEELLRIDINDNSYVFSKNNSHLKLFINNKDIYQF